MELNVKRKDLGNWMKKIKKGFGILLAVFSGLFCVSSCFCFFAVITGKLEIPTLGENVASAVFFAAFAVISAFITRLGWYLWKEREISGLFKNGQKSAARDEKEDAAVRERAELEARDAEKRKKLRPFLLEDRNPFAAYELERIYYEKLQNDTDVEQFYYAPNEVPVQLAVRKYQEYLGWRKEHFNEKDSLPKKVHIRVSSEKALAGCDDFYYEQCLKADMHIVMYTGPYTFRDVTEGKEYKVRIKTVNDGMQDGDITGVWSFQ